MTAESEPKKPKDNKKLIVTIVSSVLWVLSIALAFAIKPGDRLMFIPDSLLLLGFFPLLWLWGQGWATFLFGLFNVLIGFFLLVLRFLPTDKFTHEMIAMREHLLQMHDYWTWIVLGSVAMIWGTIETASAIWSWLAKRRRGSSPEP